MATPEAKIKNRITPILRKRMDRGLWYYMPVPYGYGRSTVDYLCCYKGRFFVIEAKAPGEEPTPRQEGELEDVRAAGGKTFVIDGYESTMELETWLCELDDR